MSDEKPIMVAGEVKPQRMLYEKCPICGGTGRRAQDSRTETNAVMIQCLCKTGYVPVGVVMSQLDHLVQVDKLRRECGITMAMLREGRCGPIERPATAEEPDNAHE